MKCCTGRKLSSPTDPTILRAAKRLANAMLAFRLMNLTNPEPVELGEVDYLPPRSRDLYQSLLWPVRKLKEVRDALFSLVKAKESSRESLPRHSAAVLDVVYHALHTFPGASSYAISDLTRNANKALCNVGELSSLSERKVGSILTSFNLTSRTRTNAGYVLNLDRQARERVHLLARTYKSNLNFALSYKNCEFCKALNNLGSSGVAFPSLLDIEKAKAAARRERRARREREKGSKLQRRGKQERQSK